MSEPAQKCENYTLELFIALKMAYCCCLGLRGNLDFPDFLQKSFITSTPGDFHFPLSPFQTTVG